MFTRERIIEAARRAGMEEDAIARLLAELPAQPTNTLTIICNDGLHPIPKEQLPGRVFAATTGNIADQTLEALQQTVADACKHVAQLIKGEGGFAEIYLVPSGYGGLLQKIAETVFQITGKPATTLHFDRKTNAYWPIRIDLRAIITQA
ncbi:MAG TPA: hypothetical protein VJ464_23840 [Blastocatellia bacterium]|nr:hypothetical protein [Blastocatellia bacterium]